MDNKNYYQDVANRIRIDMDSRSPRLRLSVLGLLLDAGVKPDIGHGEDKWALFYQGIVEYVGSGLADFAISVEQFVQEDDKKEDESGMERAANDGFGGTMIGPAKNLYRDTYNDGYM